MHHVTGGVCAQLATQAYATQQQMQQQEQEQQVDAAVEEEAEEQEEESVPTIMVRRKTKNPLGVKPALQEHTRRKPRTVPVRWEDAAAAATAAAQRLPVEAVFGDEPYFPYLPRTVWQRVGEEEEECQRPEMPPTVALYRMREFNYAATQGPREYRHRQAWQRTPQQEAQHLRQVLHAAGPHPQFPDLRL